MEANQLSTILHLGVLLALVAGVGLILVAGPIGTGVGVLLVIVGLIGLMPALHYRLAASQGSAPETAAGPREG